MSEPRPLITTTQDSFKLRRALISRYKEVMRIQFKGFVGSPVPFPPNQWRDTIRTFANGWFECLRYAGNPIGQAQWAEQFGEIQRADWYPSNEWRWWDP